MRYTFGPYDGQPFLSPDELFPHPGVMNFILKYGQDGLDALDQIENPEEQALIEAMVEAGLLEKFEDGEGQTRYRLTPKLVQGMQHRALELIFDKLKRGHRDGHPTEQHGRSTERSDGNVPYQFGDPISELDLGATMRNAVARQASAGHRPSPPIQFTTDDFELYRTESSSDCATVMLIDLSGSMYRYGRFIKAKQVALGMKALIAARFPQDTLQFACFYSLTDRLSEQEVPLVMPKPVTIRDYEVNIQLPLEKAKANRDRLPQHFTNLQLGLREARAMLTRSGAANKQIFVITDGQPTAHVAPDPATGQETLNLLYPPTDLTRDITLREAMHCKQAGIRIASFALIEDYWGMDWVGFIDQLTRLTRGVAYYCTGENLGSTVVESYLTGRKSKSFIH